MERKKQGVEEPGEASTRANESGGEREGDEEDWTTLGEGKRVDRK